MTENEWQAIIKRVQISWRKRWLPGWKKRSTVFNLGCISTKCLQWKNKSCIHALLISPSDIESVSQVEIVSICKDFKSISEGENVV